MKEDIGKILLHLILCLKEKFLEKYIHSDYLEEGVPIIYCIVIPVIIIYLIYSWKVSLVELFFIIIQMIIVLKCCLGKTNWKLYLLRFVPIFLVLIYKIEKYYHIINYLKNNMDIIIPTRIIIFFNFINRYSELIINCTIITILIEILIFLLFSIIFLLDKIFRDEKQNLNWMLIIFHQLANNVASIRGSAGIINLEDEDNENAVEILKRCDILEEITGKSIIVMNRNFTDRSRWEKIKIELIIEEIKYDYGNQVLFLRNGVHSSQRKYERKNSYIEVYKPNFEMVIHKIIDNALKYKMLNSKIVIGISYLYTSNTVIFQFTNEILEENYDNLYQKINTLNFFWEHNSYINQPMSDVPFGLAVIRYVIENMNGKATMMLQNDLKFSWIIEMPYYNNK